MSKVAVVTGSNKGLGFGIVKGLCQRFDGVVFLTSRDDTRGQNAVTELNKIGLHPEYHQLDVTEKESVTRFRDYVKQKYGGIDILINNAAVGEGLAPSTYEQSKKIIDINYKSILIIQELIYPLVKNNGRILNISSSCGHLSNLKNSYWIGRLSKRDLTGEDINDFTDWFLNSKKDGTYSSEDFVDNGVIAAYRVAKIALSAMTMIQQRELEARNISVNSMHPGIVRTDMSKGLGFYSIDQAAETPIYLVLDAPQTLKGAYVWFDKRVLDWYDYKADYYFTIAELGDGVKIL
ncbi:carbonyl reductase [NADPH] 1-like [Vanessa cardui]|uniref:carbonyl reductase [NADPH] 1-like n=1 Tax=Vanessa cardui TaxID=171605 RepID=UPI001F13C66F|nr:carbonyl reductase [NADPH] 1-like [Vanessa cardui]